MKVAVMVTPEDAQSLEPLLKTLAFINVPAVGLKLRTGWESQPRSSFEEIFSSLSHVIIVCSSVSCSSSWFSFIVGYSLGKGCQLSLYRKDSAWKVPGYLDGVMLFDSTDDLVVFFRKEREECLVAEKKQDAKNKLLEQGIPFHVDALSTCIAEGDVRSVDRFLRAGFEANSCNRNGVPLLSLAIRAKHPTMAIMLIERGADLDLKSADRGYSALMDAATAGQNDLVELLISRGANPDLTSKDGQSALVIAVGRNDVSLAKTILAAGADPDLADKLGLSARKYAALFHNPDMTALFAR